MVDVGQYETEAGRRTPKETQRQAEERSTERGKSSLTSQTCANTLVR